MMKKITQTMIITVLLLTACNPSTIPTLQSSPTNEVTTKSVPLTEAPTATTQPTVTKTEAPAPSISPTPSPTKVSSTLQVPTQIPVSPSATVNRASSALIVDHTSVDLFEQIPEEYIAAARDLKIMFADRSVGQNINESLDCLTATSWANSPAYCRRDYLPGSLKMETFLNAPPARINFTPDPQKYDRSNWIFELHSGNWDELTLDFITSLGPKYIDKVDVLSYQFTYLNVVDTSDIADPERGFFANNPDRADIYDLEAYLAQYPDKIFVYWTTSLARAIGTQVSTDFNDQMRSYVRERDLILFDIADIESHTDQGEPCFDNRDGVEWCNEGGKCENYPDDGKDYPAICQDYTTEIEGGHLGSVSAGRIRIAKAFWVLAAQIAGWTP